MNRMNKPKEEFWKQKISAWQNSSKNQSQFCRENDIQPATFYYWKKRLTEQEEPTFVRVEDALSNTTLIELSIPGGIRLIFDMTTSINMITTIVSTICQSIGMK